MDLFAQLTRGPGANDSMLCGSYGRRILDGRSVHEWRRLSSRRHRGNRDDVIDDRLWVLRDSNRLRCHRWCGDLDHEARGLRRRRLRGGSFGSTLRGRGRLFGLHWPNKAVSLRLAADSVRLGFLDRR